MDDIFKALIKQFSGEGEWWCHNIVIFIRSVWLQCIQSFALSWDKQNPEYAEYKMRHPKNPDNICQTRFFKEKYKFCFFAFVYKSFGTTLHLNYLAFLGTDKARGMYSISILIPPLVKERMHCALGIDAEWVMEIRLAVWVEFKLEVEFCLIIS